MEDWGFLHGQITDAGAAMERLELLMKYVPEKYEQFTTDELLQYPQPGKWSRQQVLGHLVDSAVHNLNRFTEAQFREQPYIIISYQQKELVEVNHYQDIPIGQLLNLWSALNCQIILVVRNTPAEKLRYPVRPPESETRLQTLEWLICDYVSHMQHHLRAMLL